VPDQHDREDLAGGIKRLDFAEADGRDGGDGLVQRGQRAEAEYDIADRPGRHDE
jgi:hypothetical protein